MAFVSQVFYLVLFIFTSIFFFFNFKLISDTWGIKQKSSTDHDQGLLELSWVENNGDGKEGQIEKVSGEDEMGEMRVVIVEKFRVLLGLESTNIRTPKSGNVDHGVSPSPGPIEAIEALTPPPLTHRHSRSPAPHSVLIHHPNNSAVRGRHKSKARIRRILIAVTVSIGATFVIAAVVVILVCHIFGRRGQKRSTRTMQVSKLSNPSNPTNKVSFDPGPELFYLNSLRPFSELVSSPKQSCETMNVLSNGKSLNSPLHEVGESSGEPMKSESDHVSCLSADILQSSDDESFHSVCDSHSSNVPFSNALEANLSDSSAISSPVYVSRSPSPNHSFTVPNLSSPTKSPTPPVTPDLTPLPLHSQSSPSSSPYNSKQTPPTDSSSVGPLRTSSYLAQMPLVAPNSTSYPNNSLSTPDKSSVFSNSVSSSSTKIEPASLPSSNESVPSLPSKPLQSLRAPLVVPGNTPPPPCPPLPPLLPPPFLKGRNSVQPPPPPPCLAQQLTAIGKNGAPLPKLKPLHWDKVRAAPDHSMVWDKLRSSSFELDEEMIESLFGYNLQSSMKNEEIKSKSPSPSKHVLDTKRLQNITILSKALNATSEQICNALMQGDGLCAQQLEALVKMVPTKEEEDKLSNYEGDVNELGSAEKFIKAMLNIPFAFQRIEAMLYRDSFEDEVVHLRKSFAMLEEACKELRSSQLFLKLLEAVLKTGNRMNVGTIRGGARAFKLDALLKLADVKGTDGKTTLLHFVVQEMIRSEGVRVSEIATEKNSQKIKHKTVKEREEYYRIMGLDLVSGLSTELCNVKKTATIDLDILATSVSNLSDGMVKLEHLVREKLSVDDRDVKFVHSMKSFTSHAGKKIKELKEDEDRVLLNVREITEYFHGNVSKDEANPLRIFVIVRDFLGMLDQVCKEVRSLKSHPVIPFR
ncbi:actin-binding FH2 (formin homology 2) family protein [Tasmannia lanceolata]|uniref:actin-binding FH2 (formin homology 2) family protein n=1 Tax=Tasmannia lanceolata TaxID=3420 RepID=UPI004063997D